MFYTLMAVWLVAFALSYAALVAILLRRARRSPR